MQDAPGKIKSGDFRGENFRKSPRRKNYFSTHLYFTEILTENMRNNLEFPFSFQPYETPLFGSFRGENTAETEYPWSYKHTKGAQPDFRQQKAA